MRVRDMMTPNPISIGPGESLEGAMEVMLRKHIRHLPVLDAAGQLVGMVTDRDLRRLTPSPLSRGDHPETVMENTTVERVMVKQPSTIAPDAPARDAVQTLIDKKYGALPVVQGGKLVGIITPIDVMKVYLKSL